MSKKSKRASKGQKRRQSTVVPAIPLAFEDAVARIVKARPRDNPKPSQTTEKKPK